MTDNRYDWLTKQSPPHGSRSLEADSILLPTRTFAPKASRPMIKPGVANPFDPSTQTEKTLPSCGNWDLNGTAGTGVGVKLSLDILLFMLGCL